MLLRCSRQNEARKHGQSRVVFVAKNNCLRRIDCCDARRPAAAKAGGWMPWAQWRRSWDVVGRLPILNFTLSENSKIFWENKHWHQWHGENFHHQIQRTWLDWAEQSYISLWAHFAVQFSLCRQWRIYHWSTWAMPHLWTAKKIVATRCQILRHQIRFRLGLRLALPRHPSWI